VRQRLYLVPVGIHFRDDALIELLLMADAKAKVAGAVPLPFSS